MRAVRTREYLFIRNFAPGRAPAGDASVKSWTADEIATSYFTEYGDIDPGPAKAFVVTHRNDAEVRPFLLRATGPRPARELYSVARDPYQLENLADRPDMATVIAALERVLIDEMRSTGDPRAFGRGDVFDRYPTYNDPGFERRPII
jgi:hypothetical protein